MDRFPRKRLQLLIYGALILAGSLYIWALMFLLKSDNWAGISALTTMLLAIAAFWSIRENRRIRLEDRERESRAQALNNIERWIKEALEIKSEYIRVPRFEVVDSELLRRVELKREMLIAQKEHIIMQARSFDSKSMPQLNLTSKIERLAHLLEFMDRKFNDSSDMLDFNLKFTEALRSIFEIRANERL